MLFGGGDLLDGKDSAMMKSRAAIVPPASAAGKRRLSSKRTSRRRCRIVQKTVTKALPLGLLARAVGQLIEQGQAMIPAVNWQDMLPDKVSLLVELSLVKSRTDSLSSRP